MDGSGDEPHASLAFVQPQVSLRIAFLRLLIFTVKQKSQRGSPGVAEGHRRRDRPGWPYFRKAARTMPDQGSSAVPVFGSSPLPGAGPMPEDENCACLDVRHML
jgi:hypothetical protein